VVFNYIAFGEKNLIGFIMVPKSTIYSTMSLYFKFNFEKIIMGPIKCFESPRFLLPVLSFKWVGSAGNLFGSNGMRRVMKPLLLKAFAPIFTPTLLREPYLKYNLY